MRDEFDAAFYGKVVPATDQAVSWLWRLVLRGLIAYLHWCNRLLARLER